MNYHDMLAYLGVGSAHPGGFAATINFLAHFPIPPGSRVLEVGCGTGRTSCYLAKCGCDVTGLDLRPHMLAKAEKRAEKEGVSVRWVEGDIRSLPFPSETFDIVLGESVTVFVDIPSALAEYYRVLQPEGKLYDREMMAVQEIPEALEKAIQELYGAVSMPMLERWIELFRAAGFQDVEVWNPTVLSDDIYHFIHMEDETLADETAPVFHPPEVETIKADNERIMKQYEKYHGYGVFIGVKKEKLERHT